MSVAAEGAKRFRLRVIPPLCETAAGVTTTSTTTPIKNMKRIISTIAALAISIAFVQTASAAKPAGEKKKHNPEETWQKIAGDKESVTKAEFTAHAKKPEAKTKLEAQFDAKDTDKDGKLTKAEFLAHGKKKK
jgi:hypothetical protein